MGSSTSKTNNPYVLPDKIGAFFQLKKDSSDIEETLSFKYIEVKQISHDTFIYRYEIPHKMNLGLQVGQHLAIDATINGEQVSRKYTPISTIHHEGYFDLLIKVYFKNTHPNFPEGGKMSQYLNDLKIGDEIQARGPFGKLQYLGHGEYKILKKFPNTYLERKYKHTLMLAGGTGITPCYQIIQACHLNGDSHKVTLIFGNKSTKDFLLKEELDKIAQEKKFEFEVVYTIDKAEEGWDGEVGFINKDMLSKYGPKPSEDVIVVTCGPPVMCKGLVPVLTDLGYNMENYHNF